MNATADKLFWSDCWLIRRPKAWRFTPSTDILTFHSNYACAWQPSAFGMFTYFPSSTNVRLWSNKVWQAGSNHLEMSCCVTSAVSWKGNICPESSQLSRQCFSVVSYKPGKFVRKVRNLLNQQLTFITSLIGCQKYKYLFHPRSIWCPHLRSIQISPTQFFTHINPFPSRISNSSSP